MSRNEIKELFTTLQSQPMKHELRRTQMENGLMAFLIGQGFGDIARAWADALAVPSNDEEPSS